MKHLILLAVVSLCSLLQQPQPIKSEQHNAQALNVKERPQDAVINVEQNQHLPNPSTKSEPRNDPVNTGLLYATAFIAVVSAIQVFYFRKSIKIVMDKERARVSIMLYSITKERNFTAPSGSDPRDLIGEGQNWALQVKYTCVFRGFTDAEIIDWRDVSYISDSPEPTTREFPPKPFDFWPIMSPPKEIELPAFTVGSVLDQEQRTRITRGERFIHIRGFVKYKDVYSRKHETRFSRVYRISYPGGVFWAGDWVETGPKWPPFRKANRAT